MILPQHLYGITGWPLGQSLSPLLHNTGFHSLEIPAVYLAWPIEPQKLAEFANAVRILPISGCSVTIPHKISIMQMLDQVSKAAELAGAVNTLYWQDGKLCGDNTDISGFLAPLPGIDPEHSDILLLGAGGAAHAVAAALIQKNCKNVMVTSPHDKSQFAFCEKFGFTPVAWASRYRQPCNLVINATPLGMKGKLADQNPYDFSLAQGRGWAYDLVYNPLETLFLKSARASGWNCISGLEMFYSQGNAQFRLWTGQDLPEASRDALIQALCAQAA